MQDENELHSAFEGEIASIRRLPPPGRREPREAPRLPLFLGFRHADDFGEVA